MVVGNDLGGTARLDDGRHATRGGAPPRRARRGAPAAAAAAIAPRPRGQRRASRYALRTFQVPAPPRAPAVPRLAVGARAVRHAGRARAGAARPGYLADVERYAQAMRIHPVSYLRRRSTSAGWSARCSAPDGRRYATALRAPISAPVLHLHGDFDSCVLPRTAQGSGQYVTGEYEWRVLDGVGHFPHNEVPELVSGELIRWAKTAG